MKCPLCGYHFNEPVNEVCYGCPLKKSCDLVKCPYCGYEFPIKKLPKFIDRLLGWYDGFKKKKSYK